MEYGARTIRGKINSKLPEFLVPIPPPVDNPESSLEGCDPVDWAQALASLEIDRSVGEVDWLVPGPSGTRATVWS